MDANKFKKALHEIKPVSFILGVLLCVTSISMLLPLWVDIYYGNSDWRFFFYGFLLTGGVGFTTAYFSYHKDMQFSARKAFCITALSWVIVPMAASLPIYFSEYIHISFASAVFEAISGITTTGSTTITGLDTAPPGVLIWRAILQWLGGVGVIVMAITVLPYLQVGGMQLFKMEALENQKALPKSAKLAVNIVMIYFILTLACFLSYKYVGMSSFDAIAHSMTTISTGGFSTKDASLGHYEGTGALIVAIIFMIMGSLPFLFYLKVVRGEKSVLFKDSQVQWFFVIIAFCSIVTIIYLVYNYNFAFEWAVKHAIFNVVSLVSGTGYASDNYGLWGSFFIVFSFFFMMIGGCAGSTTCGIKIFRFQVLTSIVHSQLNQILFSNGTFVPKFNGRRLSNEVTMSVLSFFFVYAMSFAVVALLLFLNNLDPITALSAAATSVSNVGPGLGDIIGPAGNFASLSDTVKWILCGAMILGRLEFFTILVMFTPQFWRK